MAYRGDDDDDDDHRIAEKHFNSTVIPRLMSDPANEFFG